MSPAPRPRAADAALPLVSVLTPVYNGESYLAECIESVQAQTYPHWEYVIVNNQSGDGTREIAERYARQDARIRVVDTPEFFPLMRNWNFTLRQLSPQSRYCKVLHADDALFPDCLQRMVEVAEAHPAVGVVGAYSLYGEHVRLDGVPRTQCAIDGRALCRQTLLGGPYLFGSPTALLLRSDLVRARPDFYDEDNLHADVAVCYELLQHCDFGFVHQVLTFTRQHEASITASFAHRVYSYKLADLGLLKRYGPVFLEEQEYQGRLRAERSRYYHFLAKNLTRRRDGEFWQYQRAGLQRIGEPWSPVRLARSWLGHIAHRLTNPGATLRGQLRTARSARPA